VLVREREREEKKASFKEKKSFTNQDIEEKKYCIVLRRLLIPV
jgi:hypothetical protein